MRVYQNAFAAGMRIFNVTKGFPPEEKYSMVDQIRKASRSVCANLAEAWRKRRYENHFISKLSDSEGEAAETQVWLDFAKGCGYLKPRDFEELEKAYDQVLAQIVLMIDQPEKWALPSPRRPLSPSPRRGTA